ncbi:hypothetical protein ACQR16_22045 [Bradyrhizobium oligotrophicum]
MPAKQHNPDDLSPLASVRNRVVKGAGDEFSEFAEPNNANSGMLRK